MPPKRKRVANATEEDEGPTKKQKLISTKSKSNLNQAQIIPKNTTTAGKSIGISWSSDLPPEILFRIFTVGKFKPKDLRKASQVCWSWNSCLKDESFGWAPFITITMAIIWDGKILASILVFFFSSWYFIQIIERLIKLHPKTSTLGMPRPNPIMVPNQLNLKSSTPRTTSLKTVTATTVPKWFKYEINLIEDVCY